LTHEISANGRIISRSTREALKNPGSLRMENGEWSDVAMEWK
jgi:hypothetical protein